MSRLRDAFEAVRDDDPDLLGKLLIDEPLLAAARDDDGVSLLLAACYRRRADMVAELVTALDGDLDVFEAAAVGEIDRLAALLAADPESAHHWAPGGLTALHLACYFGRGEAVAMLLKVGADLGAVSRNPMRQLPLHLAIEAGEATILGALLAGGADPDARQSGGWTALHLAVRADRRDLVEILLERGADPAVAAHDGRTPLELAMSSAVHAPISAALRGGGRNR